MTVLGELGIPTPKDLGTRFSVVGFIPTLAATLMVLLALWSGAPDQAPSIARAGNNVSDLSGGEWAVLALLLLTLVLVMQPLQLPLVRLLEGYSESPLLRPLFGRLRARQLKRVEELRCERENEDLDTRSREDAALKLRWQYPPKCSRVLPTRLGNALRAFEDRAGQYYGWSTLVAWPRLVVLMPDRALALVEDARNQLDAACRFSVSFAVASVVLLGLLVPQGWWLLIAMVPAILAYVSYLAAVSSARSYGVTVRLAFDLYRFDLLRALHIRLPRDSKEEVEISQALSNWFTRGTPHGLPYVHDQSFQATAVLAPRVADREAPDRREAGSTASPPGAPRVR